MNNEQKPQLTIPRVSRCPSINFFNVDCIEFMKSKPDKCYDLAIVDPPYGIGESNKKRSNFCVKQKNGSVLKVKDNCYTQKNWDSSPPSKDYFYELIRISRSQIIFGANYYEFAMLGFANTKVPRRNEYDLFLKNRPYGYLIWDKINGANDFNDCEIIYTSKEMKSKVIYYLWNGMFQGKMVSEDYKKANIQIADKSKNERRIHPTQKPVILYRYLLQNYTKPGDIILDTHGGSCTHAIACEIEGFDLDICEIDKEYFQAGVNAFNLHKQQQRLF